MYLVLIGALLELAGMVFLAFRAMKQEPPVSSAPLIRSHTLEPTGALLSIKGYWPGIAMIVFGALLLLIGGRI